MVFFSHLPLKLPFNFLFIIGRIGVVIFFLITGYLTVSARKKRSGKQYILNRFIRMYPVYWLLIIISFLLNYSEISLKRFLANATMFEEFLGYEPILGGSWMMPMQVCFFIGIALFGRIVLTEPVRIGKLTMKFGQVMMILTSILSLFSVITGYLRHRTGYPLPTAFFLLISVAVLGLTYKFSINLQHTVICLIIFEIGLIPSVVFSYPDKIAAYIIAYNVGICIFLIAERNNFSFKPLDKLGEIGFTFFLGADILYSIICNYFSFTSSGIMIFIGCIVKFVTAIIVAFIVTVFIEKPLIRHGKIFENRKK